MLVNFVQVTHFFAWNSGAPSFGGVLDFAHPYPPDCYATARPKRVYSNAAIHTIRDAVLTCAQKLT